MASCGPLNVTIDIKTTVVCHTQEREDLARAILEDLAIAAPNDLGGFRGLRLAGYARQLAESVLDAPRRRSMDNVDRFKQRVAEHQQMPVKNDRPAIQDLVIADIEARKLVGLQRYGTMLQAFNGRDALMDAYQEVLDLAVYLRQVMEERDAKDPDPVDPRRI